MIRHIVSAKGEAKPPPEPKIRTRRTDGARRVGAYLPTELYVAFKAFVARSGSTGEEVIVEAITRIIGHT